MNRLRASHHDQSYDQINRGGWVYGPKFCQKKKTICKIIYFNEQ